MSSRAFVAASSQYLTVSSAVVTAPPFTMACWFWSNANGTFRIPLGIGRTTATNHWQTLAVGSGPSNNQLAAVSRGPGLVQALSSSTIPTNTWNHACGLWIASNSRKIYLNGGSEGTNTSSSSPSSLNVTTVGGLNNGGTVTGLTDGRIALPAIWNVVLSADEIAALARGVNPLRIRPLSLVAFWPLWGTHDPEIDLTANARNLALVNAPTRADGPPVEPFSRRFWNIPIIQATGGDTTIPPGALALVGTLVAPTVTTGQRLQPAALLGRVTPAAPTVLVGSTIKLTNPSNTSGLVDSFTMNVTGVDGVSTITWSWAEGIYTASGSGVSVGSISPSGSWDTPQASFQPTAGGTVYFDGTFSGGEWVWVINFDTSPQYLSATAVTPGLAARAVSNLVGRSTIAPPEASYESQITIADAITLSSLLMDVMSTTGQLIILAESKDTPPRPDTEFQIFIDNVSWVDGIIFNWDWDVYGFVATSGDPVSPNTYIRPFFGDWREYEVYIERITELDFIQFHATYDYNIDDWVFELTDFSSDDTATASSGALPPPSNRKIDGLIVEPTHAGIALQAAVPAISSRGSPVALTATTGVTILLDSVHNTPPRPTTTPLTAFFDVPWAEEVNWEWVDNLFKPAGGDPVLDSSYISQKDGSWTGLEVYIEDLSGNNYAIFHGTWSNGAWNFELNDQVGAPGASMSISDMPGPAYRQMDAVIVGSTILVGTTLSLTATGTNVVLVAPVVTVSSGAIDIFPNPVVVAGSLQAITATTGRLIAVPVLLGRGVITTQALVLGNTIHITSTTANAVSVTPSVSVGSILSLDTVVATGVVPTITISSGAGVTLDTYGIAGILVTPAVLAGWETTLDANTITGITVSPSVSTGWLANLNSVAATGTLIDTTITTGQAVSVGAYLVDVKPVGPTALATSGLVLNPISGVGSITQNVVVYGTTVMVSATTTTVVVVTPTISTGWVTSLSPLQLRGIPVAPSTPSGIVLSTEPQIVYGSLVPPIVFPGLSLAVDAQLTNGVLIPPTFVYGHALGLPPTRINLTPVPLFITSDELQINAVEIYHVMANRNQGTIIKVTTRGPANSDDVGIVRSIVNSRETVDTIKVRS